MPPEPIKPSENTDSKVQVATPQALEKKPRRAPVNPSIAHQLSEENRGREHNISLLQKKVDSAKSIIDGLEAQRTQANSIINEATNEITMHRGLIMGNAKRIAELGKTPNE